jgi:tetratricopeptide (TPR) repeat protein
MFRFARAFLIGNLICGLAAAEASKPAPTAPPTKAEAIVAALAEKESTNAAPAKVDDASDPRAKLDLVRTLRFQKSYELAEKQGRDLLSEENPPEIRRLALLEIASIAQDSAQLSRAQQLYAEYVHRYPKDPSLPEVCLRQGLLYRQMGAYQQALSKFYQVMNHALSLKLDRFEYYQNLVTKAQTEIAETFFMEGKFGEAAEYYSRLLKLESKTLDRATCHFKLIRSLSAEDTREKVVAQGQSFVDLYPDSADIAEVRFLLADALKKLGRNRDAMQQVMLLLQSQQKQAEKHPELWAYWQQRTGNEIANELYKEGDYMSALEIYLGLAKVNSAAAWQLPVWYQIGLVYEHLKQPAKATEMYDQILKRQVEVRTNMPSQSTLALLEMAQWRRNYIQWGQGADAAVDKLQLPPPSPEAKTTIKSADADKQRG